MPRLTYTRDEWAAVARELAATYRESAPPGVVERVGALLAETRSAWSSEARALGLDEVSAEVVRAIVRRGRGTAADPELEDQQRASLAEADDLIRRHQRDDRMR